jgi:ring-1,2-phenylacetyl-CoA epoxidase subunit PaaE
VACKATIVCDGEERVIEINPGQNVLDAALDANIDAPYACQGGSCCTCRALLTEGKVEMKVNYALLESEVAEGYILTCQALPLTPSIRVDYDRGR